MSSITDKINDAKKALDNAMRDRRFKKERMAREKRAEYVAEVAICSGKLTACKNDLSRAIRQQSSYITEGAKQGCDTTLQEQNLKDSAIGYMLLNDAIYALRSINNSNDIEYAYRILDVAARCASGKSIKTSGMLKKLGKLKNCSDKDFEEAYNKKEELYNGIAGQLKETGDIEACLKNARPAAENEANLRSFYNNQPVVGTTASSSRVEELDRMLGDIPDDDESIDFNSFSSSPAQNIAVPKDHD